jgi:peptidoglycan/LPS O-acetylase OafA/YrhL
MISKLRDVPTLHLTFIDGMRGFAALYVVLFHVVQESKVSSPSPPFWYYFFSQGHTMVTIFIVISGFCLMLPVARNGLTLRGGAEEFFRRRARRILPPYYAALCLGIVVTVVSQPSGMRMAYIHDPSTISAVWLHLLMVHNWFLGSAYSFDGPLWSVAMECQIYLLFPLFVVAWRRFGATRTLITVGILAHAGYYFIGYRVAINYFFIFALGMMGADLVSRGRVSRSMQWTCWLSLIAYLALFRDNRAYLSDIFIGVFTATLMTALSLGSLAPIRRVLSGRVITWFGSFSYSIYLVHSIIQQGYLQTSFAATLSREPWKQGLALLLIVVPGVILISYLFYLVAERPFINRTRTAVSTITELPAAARVSP